MLCLLCQSSHCFLYSDCLLRYFSILTVLQVPWLFGAPLGGWGNKLRVNLSWCLTPNFWSLNLDLYLFGSRHVVRANTALWFFFTLLQLMMTVKVINWNFSRHDKLMDKLVAPDVGIHSIVISFQYFVSKSDNIRKKSFCG